MEGRKESLTFLPLARHGIGGMRPPPVYGEALHQNCLYLGVTITGMFSLFICFCISHILTVN